MSTGKDKAEDAKLATVAEGDKRRRAANTSPKEQARALSLQVEEDDFGGDPYNRTGQFCLIELRNREQ